MDAISYSKARKQLVETMEKVCDNHDPIIVTRRDARSVVIMSLDDYNAMEETVYLLRSSANAERLLAGMKEAESGKVKQRSVVHDEAANEKYDVTKAKK
jgi:antitoxin YefM